MRRRRPRADLRVERLQLLRLFLPTVFLVAILVGCGTASTRPPLGKQVADWQVGQPLRVSNQILTVRIDGREVEIDMRTVSVFDCRVDCFTSTRRISAFSQADTVCVGFLIERNGRQEGKVWVNRFSCEPAGRVVP
jgi:hypothetical protein